MCRIRISSFRQQKSHSVYQCDSFSWLGLMGRIKNDPKSRIRILNNSFRIHNSEIYSGLRFRFGSLSISIQLAEPNSTPMFRTIVFTKYEQNLLVLNPHSCSLEFQHRTRTAVFRIHDILVWIRIRGSLPLTNGSGSEP